MPQQQSQPSYQVEQRKNRCNEIPVSPNDVLLFYLHCQNSSLSPELAESIRQRGKEDWDGLNRALGKSPG